MKSPERKMKSVRGNAALNVFFNPVIIASANIATTRKRNAND